jgi:hypothetical protein
MHHGNSIVLVGWDPDLFLSAQRNLDLTGVGRFDNPTDWDFKFVTCFCIVPNVVALSAKTVEELGKRLGGEGGRE